MHPVFVASWLAVKHNRALRCISDKPQLAKAIDQNWEEMDAANRLLRVALQKIERPIAKEIFAAINKPLHIEGSPPLQQLDSGPYPENPEACDIFRTLVFLKYGITFRELMLGVESSAEMHRKLIDVHRDYYRILWEGALHGGLRLRFNWDHSYILVQGLDFGLDKINDLDLAECLDEICPCSRKHSVDYLKKLRARVIAAGRRLVAPDDSFAHGD